MQIEVDSSVSAVRCQLGSVQATFGFAQLITRTEIAARSTMHEIRELLAERARVKFAAELRDAFRQLATA